MALSFSGFAVKLYRLLHRFLSAADRKQFGQNKENIIPRSFRLGTHNTIFIAPTAQVSLGEDVTINQHNFITIKDKAVFTVGAETYITRATISCLEEISIGSHCILGEGLKIFDHNHKHTKEPFSVSKTEFNTAKITIGNNVWTGANVTILKGVTIGDNVILGAGVLVYNNVPANTIVTNKQELVFKTF